MAGTWRVAPIPGRLGGKPCLVLLLPQPVAAASNVILFWFGFVLFYFLFL